MELFKRLLYTCCISHKTYYNCKKANIIVQPFCRVWITLKNLKALAFFVVAVLLQINCNDYSCVEGVWLYLFFIWVFNVSSISNQSFADASHSNITRLTLPMPMACQEHLKEKNNNHNKKTDWSGHKMLLIIWTFFTIFYRTQYLDSNPWPEDDEESVPPLCCYHCH